MSSIPSIRILAIIEATSVTGPAKNLLNFCQWTRSPEGAEGIAISVELATYCRQPDDGSANLFIQAARMAGIPLHIIHERSRFDRGVLPQLAALIQKIKPDIIQTHNVKSHFLVATSRALRAQKWIAFQHGYTAVDFKMALYNQLDRWSLRRADRVVTVCNAFAPRLLGYGVAPDCLRVLHNSVLSMPIGDGSATAELRKQLGLVEEDRVIVTIGRFSREKGHADLLDALAKLQRLYPHLRWKAVFVGNGPEQPALEKKTAELNLTESVIFAGYRKNVEPFYGLASVFALPSHSEGSPNVILEAMAARVPIAATRAGGTPEVVADNETALLVPVRDAEAMARALGRLLTEEGLGARLAAAALERVRTEFSPARYRQSLTAIYCDVLGLASANANARSFLR